MTVEVIMHVLHALILVSVVTGCGGVPDSFRCDGESAEPAPQATCMPVWSCPIGTDAPAKPPDICPANRCCRSDTDRDCVVLGAMIESVDGRGQHRWWGTCWSTNS
jgi:hypothetical protein